MLLQGKQTIIIEYITDEMRTWLSNLNEDEYFIDQHTICIKYSDGVFDPLIKSGHTHPMGDDFRNSGLELTFKNEEDAVQFKLTFNDEIGNFNPNTYGFTFW